MYTVLAKVEVIVEIPTEFVSKDLAQLDAGYKIHEDALRNIEVTSINHLGERYIPKTLEWSTSIDGVFDENGTEV